MLWRCVPRGCAAAVVGASHSATPTVMQVRIRGEMPTGWASCKAGIMPAGAVEQPRSGCQLMASGQHMLDAWHGPASMPGLSNCCCCMC
jgi:hypothetical protein